MKLTYLKERKRNCLSNSDVIAFGNNGHWDQWCKYNRMGHTHLRQRKGVSTSLLYCGGWGKRIYGPFQEMEQLIKYRICLHPVQIGSSLLRSMQIKRER